MKKPVITLLCLLWFTLMVDAQGNGKFQMHFIDVGQGDATLLITPKGSTVLFDNGVKNHCELPINYLKNIGITSIDYFICSHYHDDHLGCTAEIFSKFPLKKCAYDRGDSVVSNAPSYYLETLDKKRVTAPIGTKLVLDGNKYPVTIEFVAMNGAGVKTDNENDLSLVVLVSFGNLDILMGGDLSGFSKSEYKDIESAIGRKLKQIEIYKVHHHGSQYSSNSAFLEIIKPKIGIISASPTIGKKNFGHPTEKCLKRLHEANIKTYWTELGTGAFPDKNWDKVVGSVLIEAVPGESSFDVEYGEGKSDEYDCWK